MVHIIYKHTARKSGKSYIGYTHFSIDKRWQQHCKDAFHGSDFTFHKAIRKYGTDDWEHEVLEECTGTEREVGEREQYWIARLGTTIDNDGGYNMTHGGISRLTVWSDDMKKLHKERTSRGTRLAFQNPDIKARHLVATRIASNDPENRRRNSEVQLIAQNRPETKAKHHVALKLAWGNPELPALVKRSKQIQQINKVTGEIIRVFKSARMAARELGLSQGSISNVARGRTKSAGGFLWRYVGR